MKTRANLSNRIDKKLFSQLEDEILYWKNILRRVVAVIKSLLSRGLPFRGQNEVIGSVHNGNFLMAIELVAQFDRFLAQHYMEIQAVVIHRIYHPQFMKIL